MLASNGNRPRSTYTHSVGSMGSPSTARYQQMPIEEPGQYNKPLGATPTSVTSVSRRLEETKT